MKNETIKDMIITTSYIFITEIIFKLIMGNTDPSYNILRIFLVSAIIGTIISYLTNLIKNKLVKNIILITLCILLSIYSIAQLGFSNYFGIYMSFHTSG